MSKNTESQKKKIKKVIMLLLFVVIILVCIAVVIYNSPINKKLRYIYNERKEGNIDIMPTNVDKLFEVYRGDVNQRSLYKAMDCFVNELIKKYYLATQNLNNDELDKYFNKNSTVIEKELGITDVDKFNAFCENLKKNLDEEFLNVVSYTINPNSVKSFNKYTRCSIIVNYENGKKIAFNLYIQNKTDKSKMPIYYEACVDENIISYNYINTDYETPKSAESTGKVAK